MSRNNLSERPYLARLATVLILPVTLAVYAILFYNTVADLGLTSRVYPQLLILLLLPVLASLAWSEVREWARGVENSRLLETWNRWQRSATTALWTAAFIWGIERVGFYEALVLYMLVLMPLLGVRRPVVIATFTAGTIFALYLLFDLTFRVRLPEGLLFG